MISDNTPRTWDLALRWCKSKTKWIEYVYKQFVAVYNNNVMHTYAENKRLKGLAVKRILGVAKRKRGEHYPLSYTIKLDSFLVNPTKESIEEYDLWCGVIKWENWFSRSLIWLDESIKFYVDSGYLVEDIIECINTKFKLNNVDLARFIVENNEYVDKR